MKIIGRGWTSFTRAYPDLCLMFFPQRPYPKSYPNPKPHPNPKPYPNPKPFPYPRLCPNPNLHLNPDPYPIQKLTHDGVTLII